LTAADFIDEFKRLAGRILVSNAVEEMNSRGIEPRFPDVQKYAIELAENLVSEGLVDIREAVRSAVNEFQKDAKGIVIVPRNVVTVEDLVNLWKLHKRSVELTSPALEPTIIGDEALLLGRITIASRVLDKQAIKRVENMIDKALVTMNPGEAEYAIASALSLMLYRNENPVMMDDLSKITQEIKDYGYGFSRRSYVFWRGMIKNSQYINAPAGADIIGVMLSGGLFTVEVTLKVTATQWISEIEPLWRHNRELQELLKDSWIKNFYTILIVPEIREDTFERIKELASDINITVFQFNHVKKLLRVLPLIQTLSHLKFEELIRKTRLKPEPMRSVLNANEYIKLLDEFIDNESKQWVDSSLPTLLMMKCYEKLFSRGAQTKLDNLLEDLERDQTVKEAVEFLGRNPNKTTIKQYIKEYKINSLLQYYGLAHRTNDDLKAVHIDEAVNKMLNIVGWITSLAFENKKQKQ